jgi:hypothetical protein
MCNYTLFQTMGGVPPYYAIPEPYEVDEFAWSEQSLCEDLREQGFLAARMNGGSWHVHANVDGTYSGELYEWRRTCAPPEPVVFSNASEDRALAIALEWARECTG